MNLSEDDPKPGEIWHPYTKWEEIQHNMWGTVTHRKTWLEIAVLFTGSHALYGHWMIRVIDEFPRSCENALTKQGDKRAWIGHAAVALAIGCPEDIVREAWGLLTEEQRVLANEQAQIAIDTWRKRHAETKPGN